MHHINGNFIMHSSFQSSRGMGLNQDQALTMLKLYTSPTGHYRETLSSPSIPCDCVKLNTLS